MPGYDSQVIMAAGAFVSGASIELSADGPIKPPYAVYFQGGSDLAARKIRHPEIPAAVRQKGSRFCPFVSEIIACCRTVRKKVPFLSIQKKRIMLI